MDVEWFTFETAGTLVVGWDALGAQKSPPGGATRGGRKSGVELAALVAIGETRLLFRPTVRLENAICAVRGGHCEQESLSGRH